MKWYSLILSLSLVLVSWHCSTENPSDDQQKVVTEVTDNQLTEVEKAEGWELLFDGKSMNQWRVYRKDSLYGWTIKDGEMMAGGQQNADIITKEQYDNFEIQLDWKVATAGNSGIFFNVVEADSLNAVYESGPEYQLIDDYTWPDPLEDWQKSGANYAMHTASKQVVHPANEYNHSRLRVDHGHVTHWLNGEKIVEYDLWTPEWEAMVQEGKWKDYPAYGRARKGHIALQDHGNKIWFKNIKLKQLP